MDTDSDSPVTDCPSDARSDFRDAMRACRRAHRRTRGDGGELVTCIAEARAVMEAVAGCEPTPTESEDSIEEPSEESPVEGPDPADLITFN